MYHILVINPGSTSTKIAVFEAKEKKAQYNIQHTVEALNNYQKTIDQLNYRYELVKKTLSDSGYKLKDFDIVMGRGGMLPPISSGIYIVDKQMIEILTEAKYGEHASNLGALIADRLATETRMGKAYIANPVSVDELTDIARISGVPALPRRSVFHALNHKAVANYHASLIQKKYTELNLIVAHMGGGITVAAHQQGRVVDVNQGLDGTGAISPERAGTVDAGALLRMCFSGQYNEQEISQKLVGKGGLFAHLGSKDVKTLVQQAENGDKHTALILQAMTYSIGKEIGSMYAVLKGKCDGILLTGGMAHSNYITQHITDMIANIAPVFIYPGEDEMVALAENGLHILNGTKAKHLPN